MVFHIGTAAYFVAHQVPLFLLAFSTLLVALGLTFKSIGSALTLPIGVLGIVATLAWFTLTSGGISAIPWDVAEIVGIGIAVVVVGKVFAGI